MEQSPFPCLHKEATCCPSFHKATNDLENFDKERHEEFKKYEMLKEHDRQEHLKTLDDEGRKKEEEHYEEMKKKHADHPKVNHPVGLHRRVQPESHAAVS